MSKLLEPAKLGGMLHMSPPGKAAFFGLLLAVGLSAGCKKQEAPAATSTGGEQAAATTPAPASPGAPVALPVTGTVLIPETGDVNVTLGRLTEELRRYV